MSASLICSGCRAPLAKAPANGHCPRCGTPWSTPPVVPVCETRVIMGAPAAAPDLPGVVTPTAALARANPGASGWRTPPHIPNYRELTYIAGGGMGAVFRAVQSGVERTVAIKLVSRSVMGDPASRVRFGNEMQALGRVKHPGIVQVYDSGEIDDMPYYTMEYVSGGTLTQRLAQYGGHLPADEAARIMAAVAEAVHAAHEEKVLHRDLKPGNVLMTEDGTPKVADFGLAKLTDSEFQMTVTGSQLGTPPYMAPEQIRGALEDITERSDVYGLGATLYECLTGRPPFKGTTPQETTQLVLVTEPDPPSKTRPGVPKELEAVCLKCLAKDPKQRFATARELADELRRWLAGLPTLTQPPTRWQKVRRWGGRHRIKLSAVGLVLLALFGATAGAWYFEPRRQIERDLAAGREVTLVGPTGLPRWSEWYFGDVLLTREPDGDRAAGFQTHTTSLLTLANDTACDSFELTAELRHIATNMIDGQVGVFVGRHDTPARPDLRVSRWIAVGYSDFLDKFEPRRPAAQANKLRLRVRDHLWVRRPEGGDLPNHDLGVFRFDPSLPTAPLMPWRAIRIAATPAGLRVDWRVEEPGEDQQPVLRWVRALDLSSAYLQSTTAKHNQGNETRLPGFAIPEAPWRPRGAVGIFAHGSAVEFRNVVLRPLPTSN